MDDNQQRSRHENLKHIKSDDTPVVNEAHERVCFLYMTLTDTKIREKCIDYTKAYEKKA